MLKASKLVRANSLSRALEGSMEKEAKKSERIRGLLLNEYRAKIKEQEAFELAFKKEGEVMAAFQNKIQRTRVAEESNPDFKFADRMYAYDPHDQYSELLSRIYVQNLAKCAMCTNVGERRGELKRLPCGHAIHDLCCQGLM